MDFGEQDVLKETETEKRDYESKLVSEQKRNIEIQESSNDRVNHFDNDFPIQEDFPQEKEERIIKVEEPIHNNNFDDFSVVEDEWVKEERKIEKIEETREVKEVNKKETSVEMFEEVKETKVEDKPFIKDTIEDNISTVDNNRKFIDKQEELKKEIIENQEQNKTIVDNFDDIKAKDTSLEDWRVEWYSKIWNSSTNEKAWEVVDEQIKQFSEMNDDLKKTYDKWTTIKKEINKINTKQDIQQDKDDFPVADFPVADTQWSNVVNEVVSETTKVDNNTEIDDTTKNSEIGTVENVDKWEKKDSNFSNIGNMNKESVEQQEDNQPVINKIEKPTNTTENDSNVVDWVVKETVNWVSQAADIAKNKVSWEAIAWWVAWLWMLWAFTSKWELPDTKKEKEEEQVKTTGTFKERIWTNSSAMKKMIEKGDQQVSNVVDKQQENEVKQPTRPQTNQSFQQDKSKTIEEKQELSLEENLNENPQKPEVTELKSKLEIFQDMFKVISYETVRMSTSIVILVSATVFLLWLSIIIANKMLWYTIQWWYSFVIYSLILWWFVYFLKRSF